METQNNFVHLYKSSLVELSPTVPSTDIIPDKVKVENIYYTIQKAFPKYIPGSIAPSINKILLDNNVFTYPIGGNWDDEIVREELKKLVDKYQHKHPNDMDGRIVQAVDNLTSQLDPRCLEECEIYMAYDEDITKDEKKLYDDARGIMSKKKGTMTTTGCYSHDDNTITIYYNAFNFNNSEESWVTLRRVLAHEMSHAYHNSCSPVYIDNSYYSEIVKEALADCFSCVFGIDVDFARDDSLDYSKCQRDSLARQSWWTEWRCYLLSYTYARFILYDQRMNHPTSVWLIKDYLGTDYQDKFNKVLSLSMTDMYKAYCELVPKNERKYIEDGIIKKRKRAGVLENNPIVLEPSSGSKTGIKVGFYDNEDIEWEILKGIIKAYNIISIKDLGNVIPSDVLEIKQGRFITLETGEIISAYRQWRVKDLDRFLEIAKQCGIIDINEFTNNNPSNFYNNKNQARKVIIPTGLKSLQSKQVVAKTQSVKHTPEYSRPSFIIEDKTDFLEYFGDSPIKDIFKLDEEDMWIKTTSFWDLKLSTRAQNTISQSFEERSTSKQTIEYVATEYTPNLMISRRNVGQSVFFEFMKILNEVIIEKDKALGKNRELDFSTELLNQ